MAGRVRSHSHISALADGELPTGDELLEAQHVKNAYLEDHPMTCNWLITMVIVNPLAQEGFLISGGFRGVCVL